MKNEIILFENQNVKLEVNMKDETVWLSLEQMAKLFDRDKSVVSRHIKNALEEELDNAVIAKFATTARDGKTYQVDYYNLDMIISVGYRVKSKNGIIFRKWATNILKNFSKKGYIIDKRRMENGAFFDEDYYESLLAEIREIRLSERRFYQKITDLYATSVDYDSKSPITINFFKKVQNKMNINWFVTRFQKLIR